ncbi:MAG: transporter [Candidatus Moranbacteria bacterium]|nr:transporter [Candidatus Moranbacteria bacterium]
MSPAIISILVCVALSIVTVGADYLVKRSSLQPGFSGWHSLLLGATIYALTAVGWFFTMRHLKLSTLGVLYAVTCAILLVFLGVTQFHERLVWQEVVGVAFALISLVLLSRFA